MTHHWIHQPCKTVNATALNKALAYQNTLTKPPNSLGELEKIAVQFAAWQGVIKPQCSDILVRVFAGDHGVCQQGVSAFPQEVTAQMIHNFVTGGAAISVLSRHIGADFAVVNMGTINPTEDLDGLINIQLSNGTKDFTQDSAMTENVMAAALDAGRQQILKHPCHLFIGGDMGIGNTSSASAIYSLLLELGPEITVGPGTGLDDAGLAIKRQALHNAFNYHQGSLNSPIDILRHVGGLEIAALTGAYITCAQKGIPILIDGFITTAAALLAVKLNPSVRDWMIFSHRSAEPAHIHALESLGAKPLLDLGMRLGEGSGAAIAMPIVTMALALHNEMATFADAGVSDRE